MINKSATKVGTIEFKNGRKNNLWLGHNCNTGETILWQVMQELDGRLGRSTRVTGRNLTKLAIELNDCLNEGEAKWVGARNDAAVDMLQKLLPAKA